MRKLRTMVVLVMLTFTLGLSTFAGELNSPPCAPPGIIDGPPCGAATDIQTPSASDDPGIMETPPRDYATVVFSLLENAIFV